MNLSSESFLTCPTNDTAAPQNSRRSHRRKIPRNEQLALIDAEPIAPVIEENAIAPETMDRLHALMKERLTNELLSAIMRNSSVFFERLVVDLMAAMGYGRGFVTKQTGDDGIDGIMREDPLGFSLIYIQAKRWHPLALVGKPDIQKFAGAMMGPPSSDRGLFITTARFSDRAREFAAAQHIILVDGPQLADLMIEYDLGVSTQKTYSIKSINSDYFRES